VSASFLKNLTGKSARYPSLEAEKKADPVIISTLPGSPALCLPVGRQGREASLSSLDLNFLGDTGLTGFYHKGARVAMKVHPFRRAPV
jgi:hypothetical protein